MISYELEMAGHSPSADRANIDRAETLPRKDRSTARV